MRPPQSAPLMAGAVSNVIPTVWTVPSWFIDPSNSSGCSSDQNDCQHSSCSGSQGPCNTWGEIMARFGTKTPQIQQNQTFTFMSSQTSWWDPVIYDPIIVSNNPDGSSTTGPSIQIVGTLTTSSSTTISSLTAKNTSTNVALAATIPGLAQELIVQNTSRANSIAYMARSSGTNMTQPCAPVTLTSNGEPPTLPAENNAWAATDGVNLITMPHVLITELVPQLSGLNDTGNIQVQHILIEESSPTNQPGDDRIIMGRGVVLVEDIIERNLLIQPDGPPGYNANMAIINCEVLGGFMGGPNVANPNTTLPSVPMPIYCGEISAVNNTGTGSVSFRNVFLQNDVVLRSTSVNNFVLIDGYNYFSNVQIDLTTQVRVLGGGVIDASVSGGNVTVGLIWGLGTLDAYMGTVRYSASNTGATTFPINAIKIQALTTACCMTVAAPSVVNCGLALSATALSAGACSTVGPALGDRAWQPGAGAFIGL